jgi:hypothetical protein
MENHNYIEIVLEDNGGLVMLRCLDDELLQTDR